MVEICLGTAQWGNPYGVTNASGRLSDGDLAAIVHSSRRAGIHRIDTAASYGDAHLRLKPWAHNFSITTKVNGRDSDSMLTRIDRSLAELGVSIVENILVHEWDELGADEQSLAVARLEEALRGGMARNVGVSVYDDDGLQSAAKKFGNKNVPLGVVQVPANALDRRFEGSRILRKLSDEGTRVQVRSVFLQGLLAEQGATDLGSHIDIVRFHRFAHESDRSPIELALNYVRALSWANELVLGVASAKQLEEVLHYLTRSPEDLVPIDLQSTDIELIDPRRWS